MGDGRRRSAEGDTQLHRVIFDCPRDRRENTCLYQFHTVGAVYKNSSTVLFLIDVFHGHPGYSKGPLRLPVVLLLMADDAMTTPLLAASLCFATSRDETGVSLFDETLKKKQ